MADPTRFWDPLLRLMAVYHSLDMIWDVSTMYKLTMLDVKLEAVQYHNEKRCANIVLIQNHEYRQDRLRRLYTNFT